jgi:hypothetical protein
LFENENRDVAAMWMTGAERTPATRKHRNKILMTAN